MKININNLKDFNDLDEQFEKVIKIKPKLDLDTEVNDKQKKKKKGKR